MAKVDPTLSAACRWIGLDDWRDDALAGHPQPFVFLRHLTAAQIASLSALKIACCLRYAVFLGDRLIHDGPARALPGEAYVDTVPLRSLRAAAESWFAIIAMPGTGAIASEAHTRVGVIAELRFEGHPPLVTDAAWTVRPFDEVQFHNRLCSLPTSQQEHWTLSQPLADSWRRPAKPVRVLGSAGTPPWGLLRERDCPLLVRQPITATPIFSGRDDGTAWAAADDHARRFLAADVHPIAADALSDAIELNPDRNVITFDVGQTRRVRPIVQVLVGDAGTVSVFYDIGVPGRPSASLGFEHEREGFADSITWRGGPQGVLWSPIVPRGARFVTLRTSGTTSCRLRVSFESPVYPSVAQPSPVLGGAVFKTIWQKSIATLESASDDVLVDTCWRENVLWTFDASVTGEAHFLAFNDATLWRRCLGLIARWARQSGAWPTSVVPAGVSGVILPDQGLGAVAAIDTFARLTGDNAFARVHVPCFEAFVSACLDHVTADGLFVPPDWCWHWIDWAPIDRRPYSLPINLLLLNACESAAKWCVAGPFRSRCLQAADAVRSMSEHFWDESAGCYRDRLAPPTPLPEPNQVVPMPSADVSAHSNALALQSNIADAGRRKRIAAYLAEHLEQLPFSPGWVGLILGAMVDHGEAAASLKHLERLYRPWLDADQPTWSEGFGQTVYNTAHGWGATAITVLARAARAEASESSNLFAARRARSVQHIQA